MDSIHNGEETDDTLEMRAVPRNLEILKLRKSLLMSIVLPESFAFKFPDCSRGPTQTQLTNKKDICAVQRWADKACFYLV